MKVTFEALLKKIEVKSLVSLDKGARIVLEFSGEDTKTINDINSMMRADETLNITLEKKEEK